MKKVLVSSDDQPFFEDMKMELEAYSGFLSLKTAENSESAMEILENHQIDLLIIDLDMPDEERLLDYILNNCPGKAVIPVTLLTEKELENRIPAENLIRIFKKPVDCHRLSKAVVNHIVSDTGQWMPSFCGYRRRGGPARHWEKMAATPFDVPGRLRFLCPADGPGLLEYLFEPGMTYPCLLKDRRVQVAAKHHILFKQGLLFPFR